MNQLSPSVVMESLMQSLVVRAEQQASVQHLPRAPSAEGSPSSILALVEEVGGLFPLGKLEE